jgi:hypothetical protein
MGELAWHVTMRLSDDRVLAPTTAERRVVAGVLLRCGATAGLLAFGTADTHLHALVACPRRRAGRFARDVESAIRRRLRFDAPFQPARFTAVRDQSHLRRAFRYVLRQDARHDLGRDPLREGTNLPDLLGARLAGAHTVARVRALLPRVRRGELMALFAHEPGDLPLPPRAMPTCPASLTDLREAAAAAGLLRSFDRTTAAALVVRRAAVEIARRAGLGTGPTATLLGVDRATVRRLADRPVDPAMVEAIRQQLELRDAVLGRPRRAHGGVATTRPLPEDQ